MPAPGEIGVFVDPVSHHFENDELFNPDNPHNLEDAHAPYFLLRDTFASAGIEVHTADLLRRGEHVKPMNAYFSLGLLKHYRELSARPDVVLSGLFTMEAPIVQPSTYRALPEASRHFRRIFSYTTPAALARFGCASVPLRKFHIPYAVDHVVDKYWDRTDRKFLTLLNWNRLPRMFWQELYTERLRALDFFGRYGEIDLYGMGWEHPPYRVGETRIPVQLTKLHRYVRQRAPFLKNHGRFEEAVRRTYRGVAASKYEVQSGYTFTLCYENMSLPGWVNENIFDCFVVGTIPIYLGPPDITDYVDADCFIDKRQFATYEDLRSYLHSLSPEDIQGYRERAREYLRSPRFEPFSKEAFVRLFTSAVEEDLGVSLGARGGAG